VKELGLPPDQYAPALSGLSVSFRTAPVVAPGGVVNLPLPREPGYRWSWLSAGDGPQPVSYDAAATFAGPAQLRDGWLTLVPDPAQAATPSPATPSPAAGPPATGPPATPTPAPTPTSSQGAP
jgi:hypothetical protein